MAFITEEIDQHDGGITETGAAWNEINIPKTLLVPPKIPVDVDVKGYTPPINRLPAEVLSDILLLCIRERSYSALSYKFSLKETPVGLSHVCSSWRSLIYSQPRFWKTLDIAVQVSLENHREDAEDALERFSDISDFWLEKAKNCPIGLTFRFAIERSRELFQRNPVLDYEFVLLARRFVQRNSTRISKLELEVPSPRYLALFDDSCIPNADNPFYNNFGPAMFPHLESAVIRCNHPEAPDGWVSPQPIKMFQNAPKLRKLIAIETGTVEFPLSQLTHLLLADDVMLPNFAHILSQCTNLKHGYFDLTSPRMFGNNVPTPGALRPTTLEHLETLTVLFIKEANPLVFRNFSFPKLSNLCLDCTDHMTIDSVPPTQFVGWDELFQSPSLRRLYLGHGAIPYTHIAENLRGADQITELKLDLKPSDLLPPLFDSLCMQPQADTPPILPNLETFRVCFIRRDPDLEYATGPGSQLWNNIMAPLRHPPQPRSHSPGHLTEMIESRFNSGTGSLRKFTMNVEKADRDMLPTRLLLDTRDELRECEQQGLSVDYTDNRGSDSWKTVRTEMKGASIGHWDQGPLAAGHYIGRWGEPMSKFDHNTAWETKMFMHDLD